MSPSEGDAVRKAGDTARDTGHTVRKAGHTVRETLSLTEGRESVRGNSVCMPRLTQPLGEGTMAWDCYLFN